ncbi:MAG: hypothetical protein II571_00355, partial [Lachnospiraceae bacterium]|nr:hypothetical protein [Lachnospiraceae bacterium]
NRKNRMHSIMVITDKQPPTQIMDIRSTFFIVAEKFLYSINPYAPKTTYKSKNPIPGIGIHYNY